MEEQPDRLIHFPTRVSSLEMVGFVTLTVNSTPTVKVDSAVITCICPGVPL